VQIPSLKDFKIINQYQSSSFTFVNGILGNTIEITYTLLPASSGRFTIEPVVIRSAGQTVKSNPITITVLSSSLPSSPPKPTLTSPFNPPQSFPYYSPPYSPPITTPTKSYWAEQKLSLNSVYINQGVLLTLTFYHISDLYIEGSYKLPDLSGFQVVELPQGKTQKTEVINNEEYVVEEARVLLFPITAGEKYIPPTQIEIAGSPFSSVQAETIFTNPLKLTVQPLPEEGKPAQFSGAVGQFTMEVSSPPSVAKTGESFTIDAEIRGYGNLKGIKSPSVSGGEKFEVFQSTTEENYLPEADKIYSQKKFSYLFIPKSEGEISLPPIEFNYFDPEQKKYQILTSPTAKVRVLKGASISSPSQMSTSGNEVKILGKDILYINTTANIKDFIPFIYQKTEYELYWIILAMTNLFVFILNQIKKRYQQQQKNILQKKAYKKALKSLKQISKQKIQNAEELSKQFIQIIQQYLELKFNLATTCVGEDDLQELLSKNNISESLIRKTKEFWQKTEFLRYSNNTPQQIEKTKMIEEIKEIIKSLEKESNWK